MIRAGPDTPCRRHPTPIMRGSCTCLSKLDVNHGVAGFLLANGALNAGDVEGEIRRKLLENDKVEAIIVLPRDMFYTTDISVTLWIMRMNKHAEVNREGKQLRDRFGEVLFMDLRTWDQHVETYKLDKNKRKKKVVLTPDQIAQVKSIYTAWQTGDGYVDIPELCASVKLEGEDGLRANGFTLTPSKYIEFVDHDLDIDYEGEMARIREEMRTTFRMEQESQVMLKAAFEGIGYGIA